MDSAGQSAEYCHYVQTSFLDCTGRAWSLVYARCPGPTSAVCVAVCVAVCCSAYARCPGPTSAVCVAVCVAVCCSVYARCPGPTGAVCVAVCVAVCCSVCFWWPGPTVATLDAQVSLLQCVLQCVLHVLQCPLSIPRSQYRSVCSSVLQCDAAWWNVYARCPTSPSFPYTHTQCPEYFPSLSLSRRPSKH